MRKTISTFSGLISAIMILTFLNSCQPQEDSLRWYRGNLHTHTFWSDGDDFPESVAGWYKNNGYNFLVFTDHNILLRTPVTGPFRRDHVLVEGQLWQRILNDHPALEKYISIFGEKWPETRPDEEEGYLQIRLKPLDEFQQMFDEPDNFLLMMGHEWYNEFNDPHDVHICVFIPDEVIPGIQCGVDEKERMVREVIIETNEYSNRTGRYTSPVLAHPLNKWCFTAEIILEAEDLRFFEIYNGHPNVLRFNDELYADTERIWDIVLSIRLETGQGELLYGVAADDAHSYHKPFPGYRSKGATPGRGWIMVRSAGLTEELIFDAINRGEFYSTTGVLLKNIACDGKHIHVEIEPQEGVEYVTEYIGTFSGTDTSSEPVTDSSGNELADATRRYSNDIGKILAVSNEITSGYTLTGHELYVRVRIRSSADQTDQITGEIIGKQTAWSQPFVPKVNRKEGK